MPNTLNSHVFLRIPPYPQVHVHKYLQGRGGGVFLTEALQTQRERERLGPRNYQQLQPAFIRHLSPPVRGEKRKLKFRR